MTTFDKPFLDWAKANGIDTEAMPLWPELEIDEQAGVIRVELFWTREPPEPEYPGERAYHILSGRNITTIMREYRLVEPMSADLAAAWALNSARERTANRLRDAFAGLPPGTAPSVVSANAGQRLLFIMPPMPTDDLNAALRRLAELLPGVDVSVVSGVSAVVAVDEERRKTYRDHR